VRSAIIAVRHVPPAAGRCVRSCPFVTSDDVWCLIATYETGKYFPESNYVLR
jgi:hypothetical protein